MLAVSDGIRCSSLRGRSIFKSAVEPGEEPVCEGVDPAQASGKASVETARNVFMAAHPRSDACPPQRARRPQNASDDLRALEERSAARPPAIAKVSARSTSQQ